jgi:molybdopterin synthase sulfur carrier subunit
MILHVLLIHSRKLHWFLLSLITSRGGPDAVMIRVIIPYHLRTLARVEGDMLLDVSAPVTSRAILDALEARYPMLRGTIRDHVTGQRRPMLRFFACNEDLSHDPLDAPLPAAVVSGAEPFFIVGAIAGG